MRCASCGTENAPDSRFCGGCGARLGTTGPRVAPTQKISDEASFPQRPVPAPSVARAIPPTPHVPAPIVTTQPGVTPPRLINTPAIAPPRAGSAPRAATPSPRPASAPPYPLASGAPHAPNGAVRPGPSRPPPQASQPARRPASRPASPIDEPSVSMPMPARRPWTLILVVLAVDIALATAGAWLLSEGLSDRVGSSANRASP